MVVVRCKAPVPAGLIVPTRGMVTLPDFPTALDIAKASPVLVQLVKVRMSPFRGEHVLYIADCP